MFRKGKALGELGFFEKAEKVLEEVKTKNPTGTLSDNILPGLNSVFNKSNTDAPGVTAELARLRAIDQAKEKANAQRLKGAPHISSHVLSPLINYNRVLVSRPTRKEEDTCCHCARG